ncbi:MAG: methyltransferase domain-containing protein [Pseudomonadota bacterium]
MSDKSDDGFDPNLWKPRGLEETQALYDNWAKRYDDDVTGAGYQTPARVAQTLAATVPDKSARILDFGCGTGLSGAALVAVGFSEINGTDINKSMIAKAKAKGIYSKLWVSAPGDPDITPGDYAVITATGVVSLGAAPPEMLATLLNCLTPGGYLALSYNDATLADARYVDAMDAACAELAELVSKEYGPHLKAKGMGSDVYVLRRR